MLDSSRRQIVRCTACQVRQAQHYGGPPLCRTCWRAAGHPVSTTVEREKLHLERQAARFRALRRALRPVPPPVLRTVVYHGETFDVVWDGSVAGPGTPASSAPAAAEVDLRADPAGSILPACDQVDGLSSS